MSLGERNAKARHERGLHAEAIVSADYWLFQPGEKVMTLDGLPGVVAAVYDGPFAGSEEYQVTLDNGLGGGAYTSSQLTAFKAQTASHEHTAAEDYPELGEILTDRPDPAYEMHSLGSKTAAGPGQSAGGSAFDGQHIWIISQGGNQVRQMSPTTGTVIRTFAVGSPATSVTFDGEHIWVTSVNGSMSELNPFDGTLVRTIRLGSIVEASSSCDNCGAWSGWGKPGDECKSCGSKMGGVDETTAPENKAHECAECGAYSGDDTMPHHVHAVAENEGKTPGIDDGGHLTWGGQDAQSGDDDDAYSMFEKKEASVWDDDDYAEDNSTHTIEFGNHPHGGTAWIHSTPSGKVKSGIRDEHQDPHGEAHDAMHARVEDEQHADNYFPGVRCSEDGSEENHHSQSVDRHDQRDADRDNEAMSQGAYSEHTAAGNDFFAQPKSHSNFPTGPSHDIDNKAFDSCKSCGGSGQDYFGKSCGGCGGSKVQRSASFDPYDLLVTAATDDDFRFQITASWKDVQAKAKRLRKDGFVKVLMASTAGIVAEVKGTTATYETELQYAPATTKVAIWHCGCKWGAYSWGRSGRWKRFEGRMCSHALATQYEAMSRGMFGKDVHADDKRPSWQRAHSPVVVEYDRTEQKDLTRRAVPPGNMRTTFSALSALIAEAMSQGDDPAELVLAITAAGIDNPQARFHTAGQEMSDDDPSGGNGSGPSSGEDEEEQMGDGTGMGLGGLGEAAASLSATLGDEYALMYGDEGLYSQAAFLAAVPELMEAGEAAGAASEAGGAAEGGGGLSDSLKSRMTQPHGQGGNGGGQDTGPPAAGGTGSVGSDFGVHFGQFEPVPDGALPETDGEADGHQDGGPTAGVGFDFNGDDQSGNPETKDVSPAGSGGGAAAASLETQNWQAMVAANAKAVLGKEAMKVFTPQEQHAIISEGSDVTASNLDRLDIEGTHYEALEAALASSDQDDDFLI